MGSFKTYTADASAQKLLNYAYKISKRINNWYLFMFDHIILYHDEEQTFFFKMKSILI